MTLKIYFSVLFLRQYELHFHIVSFYYETMINYYNDKKDNGLKISVSRLLRENPLKGLKKNQINVVLYKNWFPKKKIMLVNYVNH